MSYPHELLRPLHLSIPGLLEHAKEMLTNGYSDDFVALLLAGRIEIDDEERRVFVNALQEVESAQPAHCTLTGDFDSLIGVTQRLPLETPLSIFPVPQFSRTLTKNVHILLTYQYNEETKTVPLHKIANVCFASFGQRAQVRLLFPRVHERTGTPKMGQDDIADIYNLGVLPTIEEVVPHIRARWPPSYRAAVDLYHDHRGQFHHGSLDIPEDCISDFIDTLREKLEDHPRLSDFSFMIELRGTKGMFSFPLGDADARRDAFNHLIEHLDLEVEKLAGNIQNWHCDIGIEVARPGYVVQWMTNAHRSLLAYALPSQTPANVAKVHTGSQFSLDLSAHLSDLGGFRASPGSRGSHDTVSHINVYTTDKAVTYQLHHGAFSSHRAPSLYPRALPRLLSDINTIAKMFTECAGSQGESQDGTARFEIRVQIESALFSATEFPHDLLYNSAVCIPNALWWDFKFARVAAINYVLEEFSKDPPKSRILIPSLQLGAALVFMLNAVISRPGDWRAERTLADSSAWRAPDDLEVDEDHVPEMDFDPADAVPIGDRQGLYFLSDIIRDSEKRWWRLPVTERMEVPQLLSLYRAGSLADITTTMGATGLDRSTKRAHMSRTQNKKDHTMSIEYINPDAVVPLNLRLTELNLQIRPPPALSGRDVDIVPDDVEGEDTLNAETCLDTLVSRIWAQFAFDVLQVSPNRKDRDEASYLTLTQVERQEVTIDVYKHPAVPFSAVWWIVRDRAHWDLQFQRCFPPRNIKIITMQNFPNCRYYQLWIRLRSQMSAAHLDIIRSKLQPLFNSLYWLPHTESDRMWSSRQLRASERGWTYLGPAEGGATRGVRISLNPLRYNRRQPIVLGYVRAEEEEESGDDLEDPRRHPPARIRAPNGPRHSLGDSARNVRPGGTASHSGRRGNTPRFSSATPGPSQAGPSRIRPLTFEEEEEEE